MRSSFLNLLFFIITKNIESKNEWSLKINKITREIKFYNLIIKKKKITIKKFFFTLEKKKKMEENFQKKESHEEKIKEFQEKIILGLAV